MLCSRVVRSDGLTPPFASQGNLRTMVICIVGVSDQFEELQHLGVEVDEAQTKGWSSSYHNGLV